LEFCSKAFNSERPVSEKTFLRPYDLQYLLIAKVTLVSEIPPW
jgi:hypothetical protein